MTNGIQPTDPRWHRLLGLAVHEFRTPVTVVAGYIRMLLTGRAGELSEQQRRLLTEAEKSCGRLSGLIAEMSDLSALEAGSATFGKSRVDIGTLLQEAIDGLPPLPDREVAISLTNEAPGAMVDGDPTRLRAALSSVISALRRELVLNPTLLVRVTRRPAEGRSHVWISLADGEHMAAVDAAAPEALGTFNEWRGGCGLSLAVARRIIAAHDGRLWSPESDPKSGAVMAFPEAA